jgi:hypothetical protein
MEWQDVKSTIRHNSSRWLMYTLQGVRLRVINVHMNGSTLKTQSRDAVGGDDDTANESM